MLKSNPIFAKIPSRFFVNNRFLGLCQIQSSTFYFGCLTLNLFMMNHSNDQQDSTISCYKSCTKMKIGVLNSDERIKEK